MEARKFVRSFLVDALCLGFEPFAGKPPLHRGAVFVLELGVREMEVLAVAQFELVIGRRPPSVQETGEGVEAFGSGTPR
jgi:hypothetical protein